MPHSAKKVASRSFYVEFGASLCDNSLVRCNKAQPKRLPHWLCGSFGCPENLNFGISIMWSAISQVLESVGEVPIVKYCTYTILFFQLFLFIIILFSARHEKKERSKLLEKIKTAEGETRSGIKNTINSGADLPQNTFESSYDVIRRKKEENGKNGQEKTVFYYFYKFCFLVYSSVGNPPGAIFLTIGIFGTFLGLLIGNASTAINTESNESVRQSIAQLSSILSLSLLTTVFGIILSVVAKLVQHTFSHDRISPELFFDQTEQLRYQLHRLHEINSGIAKAITGSRDPAFIVGLQATKKEIAENLADISNALKASASSIANLSAASGIANPGSYNDPLKRLDELINRMGTLEQNFSNGLQQVIDNLKMGAITVSPILSHHSQSIEKMIVSVNSLVRSIEDTMNDNAKRGNGKSQNGRRGILRFLF